MNISQLLTMTARLFPDKPAIIHGNRQLTYAQFNARVNRLANAFLRLGLKQGDNVAILQHNYTETYESLLTNCPRATSARSSNGNFATVIGEIKNGRCKRWR